MEVEARAPVVAQRLLPDIGEAWWRHISAASPILRPRTLTITKSLASRLQELSVILRRLPWLDLYLRITWPDHRCYALIRRGHCASAELRAGNSGAVKASNARHFAAAIPRNSTVDDPHNFSGATIPRK